MFGISTVPSLVKVGIATHKALDALDFKVKFGFPNKAACQVTGANAAYLSILCRLTPQQREQVARGELSLSQLHNKRRHGKGNGNGSRLSNARLDQFVSRIGLARIWAAIERLTAPRTNT
jgi:hypothetical protein